VYMITLFSFILPQCSSAFAKLTIIQEKYTIINKTPARRLTPSQKRYYVYNADVVSGFYSLLAVLSHNFVFFLHVGYYD